MICKQRLFNCRWHILHQKYLNDISGKRVEVLTPVVFILTLCSSYHVSWQPSHRQSHRRHEQELHPCILPLYWDGSSGRLGEGGRVRDPTAKPGTAARCLGDSPRKDGGMCWRKAGCHVPAHCGLAMAMTSRVVSVKLSLVQPCIGRWVYLSLVMSKTQYILAVFWK